MRLRGQVTDYGDVLVHTEMIVKGQRLNFAWHIGAPRDTTAADRGQRRTRAAQLASPLAHYSGMDASMDLQADKKVTLSGAWTDEMGNPVPPPADAAATYTVDDSDIVNLTDNGDGTADAAATGSLGSAIVHAEATGNGRTSTADLLINVVAGDAERFEITASEPTEVTPDA